MDLFKDKDQPILFAIFISLLAWSTDGYISSVDTGTILSLDLTHLNPSPYNQGQKCNKYEVKAQNLSRDSSINKFQISILLKPGVKKPVSTYCNWFGNSTNIKSVAPHKRKPLAGVQIRYDPTIDIEVPFLMPRETIMTNFWSLLSRDQLEIRFTYSADGPLLAKLTKNRVLKGGSIAKWFLLNRDSIFITLVALSLASIGFWIWKSS